MTNDPRTPDEMNSESADWEVVARQDPAFAKLIDRTASGIRKSDATTIDTEAALRSVKGRAAFSQKAGKEILEFRRKSRAVPFTLIGLAAAALLAIGVWGRNNSSNRGSLIANPSRVYETAVGQIDSVTLADGTRVILGPMSRLSVQAIYGRSERSVTFSGQGFFNVVHNDKIPFIVHTGDVSIRDVGTKFNVFEYNLNASVAVMEGIVDVTFARGTRRLVKGKRVEIPIMAQDAAEQPMTVGDASSDDFAWMNRKLVFRDAPLGKALGELNRWYGVTVYYDGSLQNRHITATFEGESLDEALRVLAFSLGARIDRSNGKITLEPITTK